MLSISAADKALVEEVFHNAVDVLSKEDQKLPQVESLLPLLKRGIGIHHGGVETEPVWFVKKSDGL